MPSVGYIAYVDEAGDDGIKKLKTSTQKGASEWMVISAVLIKAERSQQTLQWVKEIVKSLDQPQLTHLHFRELAHEKREMVCRQLAALEVRLFSVISHKKNVEGYRNPRAERANVNRTARFYCWMTRLLLEQITSYCASRTMRDYSEARTLRCEFSDRGGLNIDDIRSYYRYIGAQSKMNMLHLNRFDLDWSVMETEQLFVYPNKMRAGLQLADIVASAFFSALERTADAPLKPEYAKLLLPRMASNRRSQIFGCGLKIMPRWAPSKLPPDQAEIVNFYLDR